MDISTEQFIQQFTSSVYDVQYLKGLDRRELYIDDEINSDVMRNVIVPLRQMAQENPTAPIRLFINSPGGSLLDGMVLCDIIDTIQCPLTIEIMGYAYSMAGYIAMAGYNNPNVKKVCHRFSFGLIHAGNVGFSGDARKAKQVQSFYNKLDDMAKQYILTHSKITEEQYENNLDNEWYLTSDEMIELGIVDEII